MQIGGSGANGNQILSNTIGLDVSTNARLGMAGAAWPGGHLYHRTCGSGNLIAANDAGVYLADVGTQGNVVSYSTIGTNARPASAMWPVYGTTANGQDTISG